MKALFVGGPWNGEIREAGSHLGDCALVELVAAPELTKISDYVDDALNNATYLSRKVYYTPQRFAFFGTLLNTYVADDMLSNPWLNQSVGLMLLKNEYREAVAR